VLVPMQQRTDVFSDLIITALSQLPARLVGFTAYPTFNFQVSDSTHPIAILAELLGDSAGVSGGIADMQRFFVIAVYFRYDRLDRFSNNRRAWTNAYHDERERLFGEADSDDDDKENLSAADRNARGHFANQKLIELLNSLYENREALMTEQQEPVQ
jgi:hypothetical protein